MHTDRLRLLIEVLENVQQHNLPFDMSTWINRGRYEPSGHYQHCGTSACALGHAALDPRFQALGLELLDTDGRAFRTPADYNAAMRTAPTWFSVAPWFGDDQGFSAGAACFGISRAASQFLFDPDAYYTENHGEAIEPWQVIKRIELVIEHGNEADADDRYFLPDDDEERDTDDLDD